MSTEPNTPPEVKPAITESDVVAFFQREAERIQKAHTDACTAVGFSGPGLWLRNSAGAPVWDVDAWKGSRYLIGRGATIAEAEQSFIKQLRAQLPDPAKLRAEAAEKIAEAEKLEAALRGGKEAVS